MVQIDFARRSLCYKIVYYGAGLAGKTTNMERLNRLGARDGWAGPLTSIATEGDRTLFFDIKPSGLARVGLMQTRLQCYVVPGCCYYNATRMLVLQGVDGLIFVADSSPEKAEENIESFENLEDNLRRQGLCLSSLPHVIQLNKRDLPDAVPAAVLERQLNKHQAPVIEAVASEGQGVLLTAELLSLMILRRLRLEYQLKSAPAREPAASSGRLASGARSPDETLSRLRRAFLRAPAAEAGVLDQLFDLLDRLGREQEGRSAREWALDLRSQTQRKAAIAALAKLGFHGDQVIEALARRSFQSEHEDLLKIASQSEPARRRVLDRLLEGFGLSWDIQAWRTLLGIGGPRVIARLTRQLEHGELMMRAGGEELFAVLARAFLALDAPPNSPEAARALAVIEARRGLLESSL